MRSDRGDIRVYDTNGVTALNFWLETTEASVSKIWIKVPSLEATGARTVYLTYGNPDLTGGGSGAGTFITFDDFNGSGIDYSKWSVWGGNGTIEVSNGVLRLSATAGQNCDWWNTVDRQGKALVLNTLPSGDFHAQARLMTWSNNTYNNFGLAVYQDARTAYWVYRDNGGSEALASIRTGGSNYTGFTLQPLPVYLAIRRIGGYFSLAVSYNGINWTSSPQYNDISFNNLLFFMKNWSSYPVVSGTFDNFLLRRYAATDPTVTVSPESGAPIRLLFGTKEAVSTTYVNSGRLTALVPTHEVVQAVPLTVVNPDGQVGTRESGFIYTSASGVWVGLRSPNGGELWKAGSLHNITWETIGTPDRYQLEYSLDNGASYPFLISSEVAGALRAYAWTVPAELAQPIKVRIQAFKGAEVITSESAASFLISSTDFYVRADRTAGNIDGDGTVDNPWQTITHALAQPQVVAGDTIWAKAGIYSATMDGSKESFPIVLKEGVKLASLTNPTTLATIDAGSITVEALTLPANSALEGTTVKFSGTGRGLWITGPNTAVTDVLIYGAGQGNAVFYDGSLAGAQSGGLLANCVIRNADCGVFLNGNTSVTAVTVESNTIVKDRVGIYSNQWPAAAITIRNNIISNNPSGEGTPAAGSCGLYGSALSLLNNNSFSDVYGNELNYYNTNAGGNNIVRRPRFINEAVHDYRLNHNSPCINSGTPFGTAEMGALPYTGNVALYVINPNGGETLTADSSYEVTWYATGESGPLDGFTFMYTYVYHDQSGDHPSNVTVWNDNYYPGPTYSWTPIYYSRNYRVNITASREGVLYDAASDDDFMVRYFSSDYYVDAINGDNNYTGLEAVPSGRNGPWKTLTYALSMAQTGSTVHVATGEYNAALGETFPLTIEGIRVVGNNSATVTIEGSSTAGGGLVRLRTGATLESCGIKDNGTDNNGIGVAVLGDGVDVRQNRIWHGGTPGTFYRSLEFRLNSGGQAYRNLIWNTRYAIYTRTVTPVVFDGNTITRFTAAALGGDTGTSYEARNNLISGEGAGTGLYTTGTFTSNYNNITGCAAAYSGGSAGAADTYRFPKLKSDLSLNHNSPCIDAGTPEGTDQGALQFTGLAVRLISPNGGGIVPAEAPTDLTWRASYGGNPLDITLSYSLNGGLSYDETIVSGTANDGIYSWSVPNIHSPTGRIKVRAAYDVTEAEDESDANFVFVQAATDFYVNAAIGNDLNYDGTSSEVSGLKGPWRTISYALRTVPSGATIHVAAGSYNASHGETFPLTVEADIALKSDAVPSTAAVIDGGPVAAVRLKTRTVLDGFTVTNRVSTGGYRTNYNNSTVTTLGQSVRVINNTISNTDPVNGECYPLYIAGHGTGTLSLNATIEGNTISGAQGVTVLVESSNATIRRNQIIATGTGVIIPYCGAGSGGIEGVIPVNNMLLEENTVEATATGVGIGVGGYNYRITRNKVISTTGTGNGIALQYWTGGAAVSNEVRSFYRGIYTDPYDDNILIANNTLVRNQIGIQWASGTARTIKNNIITAAPRPGSYLDGSVGFMTAGSSGVISSHNTIFNNEADYQGQVNSREDDLLTYPRFVDPNNHDYRLYADSPCVGTADDGGNRGCYPAVAFSSGITTESWVSSVYGDDARAVSTPDQPWKTINRALASTESTVHVRAGTYNAANGDVFPLAMADDQVLIGYNYQTEIATIDAGNATAVTLAPRSRLQNVTVRNNASGNNPTVLVWGADAYLHNNTIAAAGSGAGAVVVRDDRVRIEGNAISSGGGPTAVTVSNYPSNMAAATIRGNTITNTRDGATAVDFYGLALITIEGNTITVNNGIAVYPSYSIFDLRGNRLLNSNSGGGYGLFVYNSCPGTMTSNEVNGFGVSGVSYTPQSGAVLTLDRNTIVNCRWGISGVGQIISRNNIISNKPDGTTPASGSIGNANDNVLSTSTYDDVWNNATNWAYVTPGVNSISFDPQFTNPGANVYTIPWGSDCDGTGTPEGTNMGCYPSVPAGLSVRVRSPNGGEAWQTGSYHNISWGATGLVNKFRLYYSTGEAYGYQLISGEVAPRLRTYNWQVRDDLTNSARIRVEIVSGESVATDESDSVFTIYAGIGLTLFTPNGTESWEAETFQRITWEAVGTIGSFQLYYRQGGGGYQMIATGISPSSRYYDWLVPSVAGTDFKVRVQAVSPYQTATDESGANFTIYPPPPIPDNVSGEVPLYIARDGADIRITWETAVGDPQIFLLTGDGRGSFTTQEGWNLIYQSGVVQPGFGADFTAITSGLRHLDQVQMGTTEAYYKGISAEVSDVYAVNPDPFAKGASYLASVKGVGKFNVRVTPGYNLISLPFVPQGPSLAYQIGDQLTGTSESNPARSDLVMNFQNLGAVGGVPQYTYTIAWFSTADNTWYDSNNRTVPSAISLEADTAYFIKLLPTSPTTEVTLVGTVSKLKRRLPIRAGYNPAGSCFPRPSSLQILGLSAVATRSDSPNYAAKFMEMTKTGIDLGWYIIYPKTNSTWYEVNNTTLVTTLEAIPGQGYFVRELDNLADPGYIWTYPKPY
ncbi:MAG: DUF2341 domain-containing protein [Candidatus Margulisbacteria bacterium]|nr:DUF2341 domain-containing protein [Candidatus Margulisiibacteriota bacterium]